MAFGKQRVLSIQMTRALYEALETNIVLLADRAESQFHRHRCLCTQSSIKHMPRATCPGSQLSLKFGKSLSMMIMSDVEYRYIIVAVERCYMVKHWIVIFAVDVLNAPRLLL